MTNEREKEQAYKVVGGGEIGAAKAGLFSCGTNTMILYPVSGISREIGLQFWAIIKKGSRVYNIIYVWNANEIYTWKQENR